MSRIGDEEVFLTRRTREEISRAVQRVSAIMIRDTLIPREKRKREREEAGFAALICVNRDIVRSANYVDQETTAGRGSRDLYDSNKANLAGFELQMTTGS